MLRTPRSNLFFRGDERGEPDGLLLPRSARPLALARKGRKERFSSCLRRGEFYLLHLQAGGAGGPRSAGAGVCGSRQSRSRRHLSAWARCSRRRLTGRPVARPGRPGRAGPAPHTPCPTGPLPNTFFSSFSLAPGGTPRMSYSFVSATLAMAAYGQHSARQAAKRTKRSRAHEWRRRRRRPRETARGKRGGAKL